LTIMLDPLASQDPIVRAAAEKRLRLAAEASILDTVLAAYAGITVTQMTEHPAISALEHYSIWDTNCGCKTCSEWSRRQAEFNAVKRMVPKDHNYSTCSCPICRVVGRIQLNALAAANCRDLLIEISFHAEHHSPYGALVMRWLDQEMALPRYTVNWCAQEMSRYTMGWWLSRIENALSPQVSGAVFKNGMHTTDLQVHFGSSLNAMGTFNGRIND
jgi:hypothetical protein